MKVPEIYLAGAGVGILITIIGIFVSFQNTNQNDPNANYQSSNFTPTYMTSNAPFTSNASNANSANSKASQNKKIKSSKVSNSNNHSQNSLIENGAYKYNHNARVYIHKNGVLYPVENEDAYLRHYGCGKYANIADCSPVYFMPNWVTSDMFSKNRIK